MLKFQIECRFEIKRYHFRQQQITTLFCLLDVRSDNTGKAPVTLHRACLLKIKSKAAPTTVNIMKVVEAREQS